MTKANHWRKYQWQVTSFSSEDYLVQHLNSLSARGVEVFSVFGSEDAMVVVIGSEDAMVVVSREVVGGDVGAIPLHGEQDA